MRVGVVTGAAVAVSASVLSFALPTAAGGRDGAGLRDARRAAREVVRAHPSYTIIDAPQKALFALRVRSCWRVEGAAARCSLYRLAPNACALNGREGICTQSIVARNWAVVVRSRKARIVRIYRTSNMPVCADAQHPCPRDSEPERSDEPLAPEAWERPAGG
jgi:hypothetical protein